LKNRQTVMPAHAVTIAPLQKGSQGIVRRLAADAVSGGAPNLALTCQQPLRGPQRSARRSGPVLVILERRLAPSRHFPDRPGDLFPVDRGLLGIFVSFIADIRPLF